MDREILHIQRVIADWYRENQRSLPWRQTRDPYAILVSEIMLQQTGVETVIPYYERFICRFPDPQSLARAEPDEVLKSWEGLGYYARARNLHQACRLIVEQYDGKIPEDYDALTELPGIGIYTAGAVLSIAYGKPFPSVDGNIHRVFSRVYLDCAISEEREEKEYTRRLAEAHIQIAFRGGISPADFNQAYMELGALVCDPENPRCDHCPIAAYCRARETGLQQAHPLKAKKPAIETKEMEVGIVWHSRRLLLEKRQESGLLKDFWGLPTIEASSDYEPGLSLTAYLTTRFGIDCIDSKEVFRERHVFTHQRWRMRVFQVFCDPSKAEESISGRVFSFVPHEETHSLAIPKAFRKVLDRYAGRPLHVVAAILKDTLGRVFIAKRNAGGYFGGFWEFPGGKVEPGETEEAALAREIKEELSITVRPTRFLQREVYPYPFGRLQIAFYECEWEDGAIVLNAHQEGQWIKPELIKPADFPPADAGFIEAYQKELDGACGSLENGTC